MWLVQLTAIAGDSYEDIAFETSVSLAGAGRGSTMTLLDTSVTVAPCHGHRALPITDVPGSVPAFLQAIPGQKSSTRHSPSLIRPRG